MARPNAARTAAVWMIPATSVRNPAPTIQPAVSARPRSPAIAIAT